MIAARRLQRHFADGFIAEAVEDLWEPWMRHADRVLEDDALLLIVQQELAKRCKKSKTRGRKATPADVVLRMLLLKHVRNWSFEGLTREVRANLVYREFTRIGGEKVPDDRTMGNLARQLGPEVIEKIHQRVVEVAHENKIATGGKMRVDTTVVETDIHYPTDSTLLGDGVRVLTRIMKKVTAVAGKVGTQMRDRSRSAKLKVLAIARASRNKTEQGRQKMKNAYVKSASNTTGFWTAKTVASVLLPGFRCVMTPVQLHRPYRHGHDVVDLDRLLHHKRLSILHPDLIPVKPRDGAQPIADLLLVREKRSALGGFSIL
jgi:IS5 family transposase